ncbi:uncharacterized protein LOC113360178 [Papaver somniferum]|uniref:uncharacterized protein LOC113360178 n=1 Tax=Papaver somniferum TaxID=3469 RepID=UPI000E6FD07E|nr:uncharacterized protein LOC113360178 [Papaver somniferum]
MSREYIQPITVKLDGTNYNHWSFLMRSFLKGKSMWKYIDGKEKCPKSRSSTQGKEGPTKDPMEEWEINNHKILTWIGNTVITSISMLLTSFDVAKEAWYSLEKRLRKALYGLKQAPCAWFEKFSTAIIRHGYTQSPYDSALFTKSSDKGMVLLLIYVDDMVITGDDTDGITFLKSYLSSCFEMKYLGTLRYFLGIEVDKYPAGYFVSQVKYASDIISRVGLTDSKVVDAPLEMNVKFSPTDGNDLSNPTLYLQLVGSLNYLTITRPDISYVVHVVSQFMAAPRTSHFAAVLRILRYVKGTLYQALHFSSTSDLRLRAYTDSDWARDITDRQLKTCYFLFLGNSLISWRSIKQTVVSHSSVEAEYRAMAHTTSEIVWLKWILSDMGILMTDSTPLYCDNKVAIHIAHNDVFH